MVLLVLTTARQSEKTVQHAISHAKTAVSPLIALFVVDEAVTKQAIADMESNSFMDKAAGQQIAKLLADEYIERGDVMLKEVQEQAEAEHVDVHTELKVGSLFQEIKQLVADNDIERVVITRRERSTFSRVLFGSPLAELESELDIPVDVVED